MAAAVEHFPTYGICSKFIRMAICFSNLLHQTLCCLVFLFVVWPCLHCVQIAGTSYFCGHLRISQSCWYDCSSSALLDCSRDSYFCVISPKTTALWTFPTRFWQDTQQKWSNSLALAAAHCLKLYLICLYSGVVLLMEVTALEFPGWYHLI